MKHKIYILIITTLFISCKDETSKKNIINTTILGKNISENDSISLKNEILIVKKNINGEDWLRKIFKCENSIKLCLPNETLVCTKRFYDFMVDSEEIFGASNLTETEYPIAVKNYKKKWLPIYELRVDEEPFLFGRTGLDIDFLKEIKIEKISDLKYSVFVDFGESRKTSNVVTLIPFNDEFKIDYCKTKFLDN